jgi:hypothetical protein
LVGWDKEDFSASNSVTSSMSNYTSLSPVGFTVVADNRTESEVSAGLTFACC